MSKYPDCQLFVFSPEENENIMKAFSIYEKFYPQLAPLENTAFLALSCCMIHTWAEERHFDPLEIIDTIHAVMHEEIEAERRYGGN